MSTLPKKLPKKRPASRRTGQGRPQAVKVLERDTYLAMIEGAAGANMFRHLWVMAWR